MPDPAPHIHEREDEDFYILDSGLNCHIGERTRPQARLCSPRVTCAVRFSIAVSRDYRENKHSATETAKREGL